MERREIPLNGWKGEWKERERVARPARSAQTRIRRDGSGSVVARLGLILDGLVNLAPMDRDILGGFNPEAHLITADLDHGNRDVVVDDDALVFLPGENQHRRSSLSRARSARSIRDGRRPNAHETLRRVTAAFSDPILFLLTTL